MPVRKEFRRFYGENWARRIRPRILERAGHKCERCGVANYAVGYRSGPRGLFHPVPVRRRRGKEIRIVLAVCHVNNIPGDDRAENLVCLCQRCHLRNDLNFHRETRAARKDLARPLLSLEVSV